MLAKHFRTTPEFIMWNMRLDRGLIYQQAILRGLDVWTVLPEGPAPKATEADFDRLLGDTVFSG